MHVRAIRVAAALLAVPLLGARPSAQKPVNASPASPLLRLDVSVTDASGKPVPALRAADFAVTEDGRPVSIQTVTSIDPAGGGPRTYLFAVDALHLSPRGAQRVEPILSEFVRTSLRPEDRAAVAWLGPAPRMSDFTSDPQRLSAAIRSASESARSRSTARLSEFGGPDPSGVADLLDASGRTFAMLTTAIEHAAPDPGHRMAVLLISEGVPVSGTEPRATAEAQRALYAAAARGSVNLYPIDPVGMSAIDAGLEPSSESEPAGLAQWDSLRAIARETGGRAIFNTKIEPELVRIAQDNGSYYLVTYQSPHAAERDGDFHRLDVRVNVRGATVTARRGWYEPKAEQVPSP